MHERHVQEPQGEEDRDVGQAEEDEQRESQAGVAADAEGRVGGVQPEEGGQPEEGAGPATLVLAHRVQERRGRQQAIASEQGMPLEHDDEEGDRVHQAEQPKEHEARQPMGRRADLIMAGVAHGRR